MRGFARPGFRGSRMAFGPRGLHSRRVFAGRRFVGNPALRGSSLRASRRALSGRAALRSSEARRSFATRSARGVRTLTGHMPRGRAAAIGAPGRRLVALSRPDRFVAARLAGRHDWHHHWRRHRAISYGWVGPVFWPYAYDDVFVDSVWGYGLDGSDEVYEDPFWSYGYADIYGGLFAPLGTGDFIGTATTGGQTASRSGRTRKVAARRGETGTTGALAPADWRSLCGEDSRDVIGLPIERIRDIVQPNDAQRALLDELGTASVKAAQAVKAACPGDVTLTPTGRLAAMEQRLQGMRAAIDIMRPPLEAFFAVLTDEQKARLAAAGADTAEGGKARGFAQDCGAASGATEWPAERIERAIRPNEQQRAALARLKDAAIKAADTLKTACPTETPLTPPARLAAMAARLDVMLATVASVRTAATEFYGTLSDEQKAQFNTVGIAKAPAQP